METRDGFIRFGGIEIDPSTFTVSVRGSVVPLEAKAFDVLMYLIERRERVVMKEELLEALWPTFVSESVLPQSIAKIRRALGADARWVQTVRGRGYRFTGDVQLTAATSAPLSLPQPPWNALVPGPEMTAPWRQLERMFVGRSRLMGPLFERIESALVGRGRAIALVAEAGLGKTRTAEELATLAVSRGAHVAVARCREGSALAFWPWIQLLRALRPHEARDQGLTAFIGELARAAQPSPEDRFQLFDRVFAELSGAQTPLMALIDDLQWADEGSLRLLEFFLDQMDQHPMCLVVTSRPSPSRVVERTLEHVRRVRHGLVVELEALSMEDVAQLVAAAFGHSDEAAATKLHERTGGNPFFVVELLRTSLARNLTTISPSLPATIRATIEIELGELDASVLAALRAAALFGTSIPLGVLADVAEVDPTTMASALEAAAGRRLIEWDESRVAFRHDLIRETLLAGLGTSDRRALHARIAQGLLSRTRGRGDRLAEVARHLVAAGTVAAQAQAVIARAAQHALTTMAYEQAATLYAQALSVLPPEAAAAERAELVLARAEALRLGGQEQDAREASIEAASLARQDGRHDILARAALSLGADVERQRIGDGEQRRLLEEARAGLDPEAEPALCALIASRLANLPPNVDDVRRRRELSESAVALARKSENTRALGHVLRAHLVALWGPDHLDERVEVAEELMQYAERSGMLDDLATARDALALVALARGDQYTARLHLAELAKVTDKLARPGRHFRICWLRTSSAITEGRFAEAKELIARARGLADGLGDPFAQLLITVLAGNLAYELGDWNGVLMIPEALSAVYPWAGRVRIALGADMLWREGKPREAQEMLEALSIRELWAIPRDEHWMTVLAVLAMVVTRLGDRERALVLLELLEPYADQNVFNDMLATGRGPTRFYLGVLCYGLERFDEAIAHLETARTTNLRSGIEPGVVRCDIQIATALELRGGPGDRERARELARQSVEVCRRLGLHSQMSLARELLR